ESASTDKKRASLITSARLAKRLICATLAYLRASAYSYHESCVDAVEASVRAKKCHGAIGFAHVYAHARWQHLRAHVVVLVAHPSRNRGHLSSLAVGAGAVRVELVIQT